MLTKTKKAGNTFTHEAPRTLMLIAHAQVFSFVEGWNELRDETELFPFHDHAFS